MYNGIINVYKEAGYTSHDVVAKLRGILKQKKIGHTGTLDPDAVGVLPVCLGSGTKLCDMLTDKSKEYVAVMRLGVTTDTQDMSGKILTTTEVMVSKEQAEEAIYSFLGEYEQIPPMYSALKVNGKKLYELAREGKEVERKARKVQIEAIKIEEMNLPLVQMRIACSKGTYIRTLCADIGAKLGCGGAMQSLKRTRVGNFQIEDALSLAEIEALQKEDTFQNVVTAVDEVFANLDKVIVAKSHQKLIENGNCFPKTAVSQIQEQTQRQEQMQVQEQTQEQEQKQMRVYEVRVYDKTGKFYGIYRYKADRQMYYPVKMFLT